MKKNKPTGRNNERFLQRISEAGEPLFDIFEDDGIIIPKFIKNAKINRRNVLFAIGYMHQFAKQRNTKILLMMDFSLVSYIEKDAMKSLTHIQDIINSMNPPPYFQAVTVLLPKGLLDDFSKDE